MGCNHDERVRHKSVDGIESVPAFPRDVFNFVSMEEEIDAEEPDADDRGYDHQHPKISRLFQP